MSVRISRNGLIVTLLIVVAGAWLITLAASGSQAAGALPPRVTAADAGGGPAVPAPVVDDKTALAADLKQLATLASQLMDGDECHAVLTPRTYKTMWAIDPRDEWAAGDNYDYDEDVAIRVKKQLVRLARTRNYKMDCNMWLDCPEKKNTIQAVILNANSCAIYHPWGALYQDTPPIMQQALQGEIVTESPNGDWMSAFAPIRNSMGDIVGVIECCSRVEFYRARVEKK